jgi:hypothetical protein
MVERILFGLGNGMYGGHRGGVVMDGECMGLAVDPHCDSSEYGLHSALEDAGSFVEFMEERIGVKGIRSTDGDPGSGLWVYEIAVDQNHVDPDEWTHLRQGKLRRPSPDELDFVSGGIPPIGWSGSCYRL